MEFIISGYGKEPTANIVQFLFDHNEINSGFHTSIEDASFVCEGDGYLFTVTEVQNHALIYMLMKTEQGFQILDRMEIEGGYLCHITYSCNHKALYGACYETGTLFGVRVKDGCFGEMLHHEIQQKEKYGELTRAHCVLLNKNETVLAVVNIALDQVYFYGIQEGRLKLQRVLELPENTGPRHLLYSEDESLIYVITEYSNEIYIYENNDYNQLIQKVSTLAPKYTGVSNCSTLCFSKNRRFLYAANRGAETIALFGVNKDGTLIYQKEFGCGGKHPRHMLRSKDGNYMIVCNQLSDRVAIFPLEPETGELLEEVASIKFSAPSGIVELG